MNRRRFLSFLSLAPVAAAVPAMALPRPDEPKIKYGPSGEAVIGKQFDDYTGWSSSNRSMKSSKLSSSIARNWLTK